MGRLNITSIFLLGIMGLVAYKLISSPNTPFIIGAGSASQNSVPQGGVAPAGTPQPDLASTIANAATSIFGSIATIWQSSQKTN